jgi:predicted transcriptional regulator
MLATGTKVLLRSAINQTAKRAMTTPWVLDKGVVMATWAFKGVEYAAVVWDDDGQEIHEAAGLLPYTRDLRTSPLNAPPKRKSCRQHAG